MTAPLRPIVLFCAAFIQLSCTTPAQRIHQRAAELGLVERIVRGSEWDHVVFVNSSPVQAGRLHIYIEGDGSPWIAKRWVARDPTPRKPLMLELMAQDRQPSIYLGRPCYLGLADDPGCTPWLWTQGRYSERVVNSMAGALKRILDQRAQGAELVWFGHSGGGTLAMLLAEHFEGETVAVVTVAGNLDTQAWTAHHGYRPLSGSLNPAARSPLPEHIRMTHLIGMQDQSVPAHITEAAVAGQGKGELWRYPDFDHTCCWQRIWPSVLDRLP